MGARPFTSMAPTCRFQHTILTNERGHEDAGALGGQRKANKAAKVELGGTPPGPPGPAEYWPKSIRAYYVL